MKKKMSGLCHNKQSLLFPRQGQKVPRFSEGLDFSFQSFLLNYRIKTQDKHLRVETGKQHREQEADGPP